MKKYFTFSSLIMLSLILNMMQCFDLYGNWSLQKIKDFPVLYEPTVMKIEQFIFRNTTVQQQLTFSGCQSFKYILSVSQSNLFINYNTYYNNGSSNVSCSQSILSQSAFLIESLKNCFIFKINGSRLIFYDLNNTNILQFQRILGQKTTLVKFFGNFHSNIVLINSKWANQTFNATNSQVTLCSGKIVLDYQTGLTGNYSVKFTLRTNQVCNTSLDSRDALLNAVFYRINNETLQLYDNSINMIVLIQKEISQPARNQAFNQTMTQTTEIQGLWQPALIYSMPVPSNQIYLIITENSISYNGGCNSYIFQYGMQQNTSSLIIGRNRSTNIICQVDDDQLYVKAISSAKQYSITNDSGRTVLSLQDINGKNLFVLVKIIAQAQSTVNSTDQTNTTNFSNITASPTNKSTDNQTKTTDFSNITSSPTNTTSNTIILSTSKTISPPSIVPSRYICLLVFNLGFPRIFIDISPSSISYITSCSTITQSYTIKSSFQISISQPLLPSNCFNPNDDKVYSDIFAKVRFYYQAMDMGTYQLNDANNQTIVYLSPL